MSVDLQPHPLAFPHPINQIVKVPIDDLYDPDWNPRPIVDEGPLQNLIDFIKAGGYTPPILAWVGTGQKPWAVIAGKRRRLAYHRLGRTEVEVIFMDCTEAKAKDWSQASNEDDKPFWLGTYIETEAKLAEYGGSYGNLGKAIGKSKSWVGQAILITKLLSNESRKLIFDQYFEAVHTVDEVEQTSENPEEINLEKGKEKQKKAKTSDKKWFLTESVVREVLPLFNDRPEIEAVRLADQAIPFMLSAKMDMKQTARLVTLLIEGKTPDEIKEIFEKPAHVEDKAVSHSLSDHSKSDARPHDEAKGADSPMESAHPKSVAQLVAEPQGAGSPLEPAHTKSVAQLVAEPQGLSSPTVSTDPKGAPAEDGQPKPKGGEAPASGFWKDIQDIFQGFTGAGIKDLFGKIPQGNKWQALGYIFEKILLGGMGHLIKLGWKLFILLAKHTGKGIHNFSKSIANMVVPISRSGSSHPHGSSSRSQNPFLYIGHWLVYGFITLVCYSILLSSIGNFVPGVGPWVRAEVMALAHLLAQVPLWVCYQILQNAWMAIGFGLLLLWMIHKTFNPGFGWILTLGVILFAAWCLRGWVINGCHVTLPDFSSFTMPKVAETVPPGPKPQVDLSTVASAKVEEPPTQKVAQTKPTTAQHKKTAPGKKKTPIPLSQMALPMHIPTDSQFAEAFCAALYNIKYQDPYFNSDAVAAMLTTDNGQDIVDGYYAEDRMKRIEDGKETWTFKADGDPVMTAQKGDDKDFLVKGSYSISVVGQSYVDVRPFSAIVTICHDRKGFPQVRDIQVQKEPEKE